MQRFSMLFNTVDKEASVSTMISIAETKAAEEEKMPIGRRNDATRTMMSRTMPCNASTCSLTSSTQKAVTRGRCLKYSPVGCWKADFTTKGNLHGRPHLSCKVHMNNHRLPSARSEHLALITLPLILSTSNHFNDILRKTLPDS